MSWDYLIDATAGPKWKGLLPGRPDAFFLKRGEGEHALLGIDLFTVLLSADETEGQFGVFTSQAPAGQLLMAHTHADTHETFYVMEGKVRLFVQDRSGTKRSQLLEPGDFGYVPAGLPHAYKVEESARLMGVVTGGFERFFQEMGEPTDRPTVDQPPAIPEFPRVHATGQKYRTEFIPGFSWPDAEG